MEEVMMMAEWVRRVRQATNAAKRKNFLIFKYYRIYDFEIYGTTRLINISRKRCRRGYPE
jgi:hypothetical protein